MPTPRVVAIHDISGFGRCSMTIIMPALSVMGVQCCPLPTALLSTHTGGFQGNTFLDLTDQMGPIAAHWREEGVAFDGIYTGFMSSVEQMEQTAAFIRSFRRQGCPVLIDPVMGDHGRPYRTYTPEMCRAMAELAAEADVLTPNRTEAALLLGMPYEALPTGGAGCREIAERLSLEGRRSVVLTGASTAPGLTGATCFDAGTGRLETIQTRWVPREFHGTGDVFASVLTGALLQGDPLPRAAQRAAKFVRDCAARTAAEDLPPREGVDFEPLLWRLGRALEEGR